jgi:hypothetical protein
MWCSFSFDPTQTLTRKLVQKLEKLQECHLQEFTTQSTSYSFPLSDLHMEIRMWVLTIISAAAAATDMEEKIVHKSTWLLSICL